MQNQGYIRNFNFFVLHFSWFDKLTMTLSPSNGSFCNAPLVLALLVSLWIAPPALASQPVDLEEQVRRIAAELRCVVCQNLSVADSPSELAQQMRAVIREQLQQGKRPEEIRAYFVSKYGEWVLLAPTPKGFSLLVWVLPFVAVAAGILLVVFVVRRWVDKKNRLQPTTVDPALIERVRQEVAAERPSPVNLESEDPRALLLQEQARLYSDLKDLEFDYQAGKLSEADYQELRHSQETQAAMVLKELDSTASTRRAPPSAPKPEKTPPKKDVGEASTAPKGWRLAAAGAFLLLFGVTLGVLLTKSLRPRGSEQDSITGDFLTGTGPGGVGKSSGMAGMEMGTSSSKALQPLLAQGRAAYERQEWPAAIDSFKRALAIDPNQPEAHTYLGLILTQAGHADGALSAFDRALSSDPNFPLALWGKGMLLYRAKGDFSAARQTLERLVSLLPLGAERNEIEKILVELDSRQKEPLKKEKVVGAAAQIQGVVSVAEKLKTKVDSKAVLFIIARSANSAGGPPLAVKKVDRPVFPVSYTLGSENVMTPGVPFSGKVLISARLDKDGNPATREPGNLTGEYKKNPVEIGSGKVDIVIDQVM
ncbi:MAG: cytochrome c-type biogenesis protein CcmH [Deltaproteobacteria bacterium]|nr:cytochrome c-type biogenesis protein CcmH [Deltaproteobacteria bacterium]